MLYEASGEDCLNSAGTEHFSASPTSFCFLSKDVTLMTGIPAAIFDHEAIHGEEERQKEVGS